NAAYRHLLSLKGAPKKRIALASDYQVGDPLAFTIVPRDRSNYLAEIAQAVRGYHQRVQGACQVLSDVEGFERALQQKLSDGTRRELQALLEQKRAAVDPEVMTALNAYEKLAPKYAG